MPGMWERLAGSERGRLETSDCESLGSASGSEGGEWGRAFPGGSGGTRGTSLRGWEVTQGPSEEPGGD